MRRPFRYIAEIKMHCLVLVKREPDERQTRNPANKLRLRTVQPTEVTIKAYKQ